MPGETFHADRRQQPVRRLEARNPTESRWANHRAPGLAADADREHPGRNRRGRPGRGAAGGVLGIVGIAGWPWAHECELSGDRLAENEPTDPTDFGDQRRVAARSMTRVDRRA